MYGYCLMLDSYYFRSGSFLSNFYAAPIFYDGKVWPTSEHLYQALKFNNLKIQEMVRLKTSPGEAKKFARVLIRRENWDDVKYDIMEQVVYLKFSQNVELKKRLLDTKDLRLIEFTTWDDTTWGVNSYLEGTNWLGQILVSVREKLRNEERHK